MAITDLPLFSMLRTRMQWHQERQRILAENVANADTRNFRPRDLAPLRFEQSKMALSPANLRGADSAQVASLDGSSSRFPSARTGSFEVRPSGTAINLEDEMLKVAANQMDFQAATTLYTKSLGLIKTAIGKR